MNGRRWTRFFAGLLLVAAALTPRAARAQGMYYKEIEKDGRVYVFNLAVEAERFEKSGEIGRAITKPAYGPGGVTVVFDSEQAMDLYNFKHGIAVVVDRPKVPTQTIVWRDGKTRITTDNAYVEISNRIQSRFTQEMPDDAVTLPGTFGPGDSKGSFRIRRAKFKTEGWFYKPWLQFEVQLNWPDVTGTPASRFLEDANINWDITKGKKNLMVRFGQFKVPYGRQQITSSGSQQFVDRSAVSDRYALGRDTGVAVWGTFGTKLEWRAGAFNGNGRSQTLNDNAKYQYNARIMWQPNGSQALGVWSSGALWSESDFESTDRPIYALAANFEANNKQLATTNIDLNDRTWSVDAVFKFKGFSVVADYYNRDSDPETGSSFKDKGYYGQAGFFLNKGRNWEVVGRYGSFDPTDLVSGNDQKEIGGGLNYFYNRHNLKVQADFRQLENKANGQKNKEARLQTQLIF